MKTLPFFSGPAHCPALLAALTAVLLVGAGCFGGGDADEASQQDVGTSQAQSGSQNPFQAMTEMGKQMEEMGKKMEERQNRTVEPVNFRKLRALLPAALADSLKRTAMEGQTGGAMGMNVSTAEATYESEAEGTGRRRVEIKITDMGAMSGFGALGYGWAMMNIDKESSSGYERTMQYDGHKAHEKYDRDRRRGEMQVLVADRFVVAVEGRDVEMDTVKSALAQVDLSALTAMRDEGVQEG